MHNRIRSTIRTCMYYLNLIQKIIPYLTVDATKIPSVVLCHYSLPRYVQTIASHFRFTTENPTVTPSKGPEHRGKTNVSKTKTKDVDDDHDDVVVVVDDAGFRTIWRPTKVDASCGLYQAKVSIFICLTIHFNIFSGVKYIG